MLSRTSVHEVAGQDFRDKLLKTSQNVFIGPKWWFQPNAVGVYIANIRISVIIKGGMRGLPQ